MLWSLAFVNNGLHVSVRVYNMLLDLYILPSFHPWVGELTLVVGAMGLVAAFKVIVVSFTMVASFLHVS